MKKIIIIFVAMAAVLSSCSKSEIEIVSANDDKGIVLNINVSDPGADTKRPVKEYWDINDEISIWFDANTGETPDLVIIYAGANKWIQKQDASVSGNTPSTGEGKYAKSLYNGTLKVASKDDYTYTDNILTFNIANWVFLTEIQVTVKGLSSTDSANYSLSCSNFTPLTGVTVGTDAITATAGAANTPVNGITDAEGVAFVFASCTKYNSTDTYKFTLTDSTSNGDASTSAPTTPDCVEIEAEYDGTNLSKLKWAKWNVGASKPEEYGYHFFWGGTQGYVYSTAKKVYSKNRSINKNVRSLQAFRILNTNFINCWVRADNGEELVDGFCWKNAPFNNGNSDYDETYFASVRPTVCPNGILAPDYDAAYKYLGDGFRMPTKAEVEAMRAVTYWVWNYGDKGYYVFKPEDAYKGWAGHEGIWDYRDDKTKALLFFPTSGTGMQTVYDAPGSFGYCWTSSLDTSNPKRAHIIYWYFSAMYGSTPFVNVHTHEHYMGNTIRPVSD